ncbi:glycoside hydrolase, partial [Mycena vulgaris]
IGPTLTYLANCGNASCTDFDVTKAKWFKIDEQGRYIYVSHGWAQNKTSAPRSPANVTIPANLKAGNYILRYQISALHRAKYLGQAEFYSSWSQLAVTGGGTGGIP